MKTVRFTVSRRKAELQDSKYAGKLTDFFSYSVPGARFIPSFRMGAWDGRISVMKHNQVGIGLLRGMKDELAKAGFKIEVSRWDDRPKIPIAKKGIVSDKDHAYQNDCVKAMLDAIPWGGGLVISATGTGKTAMAAMLASWTKCPILFVVDTIDLLYQSQKEISVWLTKHSGVATPVGAVGNGWFDPKRVTIATIQTLHAHRADPEFRKWFKTVEMVLIDEIHVQMSRRNFSVLDLIKPKAVYGLTATLQLRKKEVRMKAYSICGPVIYEFKVDAGAEAGVLTKGCVANVVVETRRMLGDKNVEEDYLDYVVTNTQANTAVCKLVIESLKRGYYVAVLVDRRKHIRRMEDLLHKFNPQICYGGTSSDARERRKQRFEQGKSRLLVASRVFTKGVNLKRLDLIIDAAQRGNKNDALQKYGRGVRLHSEKNGLIFIRIMTAVVPSEIKKGKLVKSRTEKAGTSCINAFKKAKIPVMQIAYISGKQVLDKAEKFLSKTLKEKSPKRSK